MKKEFYDRIAEPFAKNRRLQNLLLRLNVVITAAVYIVYPLLLIWLAAHRDVRWLRVLLIPAVSFVAVTLLRGLCNFKRPYEVWEVRPLIPKATKGHSFPSRHVFSIYIIAMAAGYIRPWLAEALMVAGVFLAAVRVIGRVHFIRDVAWGAGIALATGWIGFYLIP